jgi:putative nucleotidyltransferase with HDIG domain
MLSSLFEMYSLQTLSHSQVTAYIAYSLAKKMKLKSSNQKKLYVAGLVHDLGKVSVPLRILEKPDKLTDQEYNKMKKHVTYTKEILDGKMDFDIVEIAYRHHERIDGKGYPNKVKGENMTIDQKILQVADVISALSAKRSYKEAWSIEKTISILEENVLRGQMEKSIVDCFKENQEKIMKESTKLMNDTEKIYLKINKERELLSNK